MTSYLQRILTVIKLTEILNFDIEIFCLAFEIILYVISLGGVVISSTTNKGYRTSRAQCNSEIPHGLYSYSGF